MIRPTVPIEPDVGEAPADFVARVGAAARRHRTPCGDGSLVWREWGAGSPLLALHGGSGSWTHWIRNIGWLATRHRLLVPDLPGLGDSALPPASFGWDDLHASVEMLAEIVSDGARALAAENEPWHVVGFSLGSIVASRLVADRGIAARSLTIVGGSALGVGWPGLRGELRGVGPDAEREEQIETQRYNLGIIMLSGKRPADDLAAYVQLENVRRARIRTHALAGSDVMASVLPRIDTRFNAVWGADDVYALPGVEICAGVIRDHHPQADIHVIDDAGHWVMYEQADAFNQVLGSIFTSADG